MQVEAEVIIYAPVETVWTVVTDPLLAPRWNSNVKLVRDFSGQPIAAGSRWVQEVLILGRLTAMSATVVHCRPPWHGEVKFSGSGNPRVRTDLEEIEGGTVVRQVMSFDDVSGVTGLALRMAKSTLQRELDQALQRQKQVVENRAA